MKKKTPPKHSFSGESRFALYTLWKFTLIKSLILLPSNVVQHLCDIFNIDFESRSLIFLVFFFRFSGYVLRSGRRPKNARPTPPAPIDFRKSNRPKLFKQLIYRKKKNCRTLNQWFPIGGRRTPWGPRVDVRVSVVM